MVHPEPRPARRPAWIRWGQVLVITVVMASIGYWVWRHRDSLAEALGQVGIWPVLAAFACGTFAAWTGAPAWREVLAGLGSPVRLPAAQRVFLVGQLGKYVPGGVWSVVGQAALARELSVPRHRSAAASLLTIVISIVTASVLGAACLVIAGGPVLGEYWWALLLVLPLVALLHPAVLAWAGALAGRLTGRGSQLGRLPAGRSTAAAGWLAAGQVMNGLQFAFIVAAVGGTFPDPLLAIGVFSVASAVGIVVVIAPAGAGPRELVLLLGLSPLMEPGPALLVVLMSRLVLTVSDLVLAAVSARFGRLGRDAGARSAPLLRPAPGGGARAVLRVVAFGTYQADAHPRIRVLIEGLRTNKHQVVEVNHPLRLSTAERVAMLRRWWSVPKLGWRMARCWWRLRRDGRRVLRDREVDIVLVGYMGHFDVHLARRVFKGIPVVLDHLIFASLTASDRGVPDGRMTRALAALDRRALRCADVIVLDTFEHQQVVPAELRPRSVVCPVGADSRWFAAADTACPDPGPDGPISVVFFGLYTPLQGAIVIGQALRMLADRDDIRVTMIGQGQESEPARAAAGPSTYVEWVRWVSPDDLPSVVARHHVGLGIFGTTEKAAQVVPNKVYGSAAAGLAIVTSDTTPQRRTLGSAALLVPRGDPEALARALIRLSEDRDLLAGYRSAARELANREFHGAATAARLVDHLRCH